MLKNYFKIAWRNLIKDKQFTLLNLLGLSTGLACVILIFLWISDELSIDKFNANDSRLFQVLKNGPDGTGAIQTLETTQALLAQSMARDLPEVQYAVAVHKERPSILSANDKKIKMNAEFVNEDFFKVFSYPILEGNKTIPLSDKFSVLISDKLALKLFNSSKDILGKSVSWNMNDEFTEIYKIAGIFKSAPSNSTDQPDMLLSYDLYLDKEKKWLNWESNNVSTYLLLKKGTDIDAFSKKIEKFTQEKLKTIYTDKNYLQYLLQWEGTLSIQKYSDKYLYNHYSNGVVDGGRIEYVKLFSIIAGFILMIACINFMNLSTAKASRRMKEVGIKKVVGASRSSLIFQYIGESMLMAFTSLLIAWAIVVLVFPVFNEITGKNIKLHFDKGIILSTILIAIITGIISGSYPAFYLSAFRPVAVLKGKLQSFSKELWVRKGLVVFQFSISVILIVSVLVIYQQMKLIQNVNLGFNKDNILTFSTDGDLKQHLTSFLAEAKKIPGVVNASDQNGDFLGQTSHGGGGISWEGKDPNLGIEYYGNDVDYDFFETMGLQMAEGRAFSRDFNDSSSVIFNQSAIAAMGLKNPVGKTVSLWDKKATIIGVVKDYHFQSLYQKIGPSFLTFSPNNETTLVRIKAGTEEQTIPAIKALFNKYSSGLDFNYSFLDDDYNRLYASEQRVAALSKYFAAIAIIISCLGLFGLAAFTAQKRQKEIGIRKVIGASVANVVVMLSRDFLGLVCISLLVAIPISWWAANQWLQSFAYRIHISPFVFLITSLMVVLITVITISFQSIRAAIANPVKSLRME